MAILHITFLSSETLVLAAVGIILIYIWFKHKFTYWAKKGVFAPTPSFPFGHIKNVIMRKEQFFEPYCKMYFKYKSLPFVGMYCFNQPVLCINDLDLAKHVLIKDYDHFQAHGIFSGGAGDPLAGHLFNLHGSAWKSLRNKLAPSFSPSKIKGMYPLVEKIAKESLLYADSIQSTSEVINMSEFYEKYTMEIIGSVGFGVECNGFNNSQSEFYLRGREYFEPTSIYWTIVRAFAFIMPDVFQKLKIKRINPDIINFFYNLVKETVEYRNKHCYKRNDFLQTLIELRENFAFDNRDTLTASCFTLDDIAANTMLYMFAGYETSATTGQFAAYELARHPDIQAKARAEIDSVLAKYEGDCTFEAQNEMVYLNMVLDETMRKYPPMRALFRRCNKDYKIPNSEIIIDEGTLIFIPAQSIQMDPDIYSDPQRFDPERFTPEKKNSMHPCQWMPFGEGPRKCLGLRQGYIQSKLALVKLLHNYELFVDDRMQVPLKIKASSLACAVQGDVWIRLKKINS